MREALLAEFDHEMGITRKLLECAAGCDRQWKPHVRSRSLGGLIDHLTVITGWGDAILNRVFFDLDDAPSAADENVTRTHADVLRAFDDAARRARLWLDKSDAELMARWALRRGGQELFALPRASAFRAFVLYHGAHHRGQLGVYLRMNDVPLPAVYGPSADETRGV